LLQDVADKLKALSVLRQLWGEVCRLRQAAEEREALILAEKALKEKALEQISLLEETSRTRVDEELRGTLIQIVEDVHLQCPQIDFLKVGGIGAFGEQHLVMTGKRKRETSEEEDSKKGNSPGGKSHE
jgi:hypothetical protein